MICDTDKKGFPLFFLTIQHIFTAHFFAVEKKILTEERMEHVRSIMHAHKETISYSLFLDVRTQ
jgi:hypothetical protein